MKQKLLFFIVILISSNVFSQKNNFDKYFKYETLRLDYIHAGNSESEYIYFEKLKQEPFWGGSRKNLIDVFNYGDYRVEVLDKKTEKVIYSYGYSTLFQEWQATEEAKSLNKSFYESVTVPFPKNPIIIIIEKRNKKYTYDEIFRYEVSPDNMFIKKGLEYNFETKDILDNGNPAKKVDIVILAEGYTKNEMPKFEKDAEKMMNTLFSYQPFKSNKNKFNVHLVLSHSEESGTDIPGDNIWKNTLFNSNFYTFGSERYITTQDYETVRDVAALAPYDQIFILVNTAKYGGGGIYNFLNLCVADHKLAPQVFVHEFGHGFGGLADEYWTSEVAVQDYFSQDIEPSDPNITTLVNFESKWADLVKKNTPIPTPSTPEYKNKVGVFEGGGYVAKGVYRPQQDCMMRALEYDFCKVCNRSIKKIIKFFSE